MKKNKLKINGSNRLEPRFLPILFAVGLAMLFGQSAIANTKKNAPLGEQKLQQEINGVVLDETGNPLPGASVVEKGTANGTQTDFDGNFSLRVANDNATLVISYIGFETKEVLWNGQSNVAITLQESTSQLDEVVIIGYGSTTLKESTGAVANIKVEDIRQAANTSVDQMLQGRVAGLNLGLSTAQPGARVSANIRADISPRGSGEPLYVVDGVPIINSSPEPSLNSSDLGFFGGVDRSPLSTINPADIESVDVIKDASTTAIYGSAAANGVIFITTKKGRVGKATVDYRVSTTVQTPKDYLEFLDAENFMQQHNRLAFDRYLFDNKFAPYGAQNAPANGFTPFFTQGDIANAGRGVDYVGALIKSGFIQEHNLSINGGTENTRIYTSFNYYDNEAILKGSDFQRFTARFNLTQKLGERFNLNLKTNLSQINSNNASTGANSGGSEKFNMLQSAYAFAPTIPIFEEDGSFSRTYNTLIVNPLAFLTIDDELRTNRFSITPKLDVQLFNELTLSLLGSMDRTTSTRKFFIPSIAEHSLLPTGMAQLATNRNDAYTGEAYFTYTKSFENSTISAVLGAGVYKTLGDGFSLQAVGFFTDALGFDNVGVADELLRNTQDSFRFETNRLSQFARINYTINGKYVLNGVVRRDGASNFATNNKWGVFPGISAAWRISEEPFLNNSKVSNLKLRVGYGEVGNVVLADNALQLYAVNGEFTFGNTVQPGVVLSQVENPDFRWETNTSIDMGLDFGFFNDRISGSLEVYEKKAKDLIDFDPLPSNNAVGRVVTNIGSTRARGIDIALRTTNILSENFEWGTNFTFTSSRSEWLERNPNVPLPSYIGPNDDLNAFYGWETDGLIRSLEEVPNHMAGAFPGNVRFIDQNNDGLLDENDVVNLGTWGPRVNFGIGTNLRIKNFTFSAFAYGNAGAPRGFGFFPNSFRLSNSSPSNTLTSARDVWSFDNPDGILPGIASNPFSGNNPTGITDFLLKKSWFLRIKNINLGYDLPISGNSGVPIQKMRIFLDFQNVALFSNFDGFDPELDTTNPFPQALSSTLGVDIQF
ncbi:SusC/RagA family TonB-linked outer membrane protein [Flagellimonas myxillae]|uniref:SusC/RagA family TonB-linked outer membrane protein n=1 Tax=Flagellimonas myxillae TaxID=2942214 RepID=UPI00201F1ECB|nr:TonB-dependent receptor [Muricauda myxillae]MCL6266328.1 TonB-dependent receptor [Muricauda myxillae]